MSIMSFILIITTFIIDNLKEPSIGFKDAHPSYDFLKLFIIGLSMVISLILSIIVIIRVIKYWKVWPNLKSKYLIFGLALPAIISYVNLLTLIFKN